LQFTFGGNKVVEAKGTGHKMGRLDNTVGGLEINDMSFNPIPATVKEPDMNNTKS
jgi:hypothetical protein